MPLIFTNSSEHTDTTVLPRSPAFAGCPQNASKENLEIAGLIITYKPSTLLIHNRPPSAKQNVFLIKIVKKIISLFIASFPFITYKITNKIVFKFYKLQLLHKNQFTRQL